MWVYCAGYCTYQRKSHNLQQFLASVTSVLALAIYNVISIGMHFYQEKFKFMCILFFMKQPSAALRVSPVGETCCNPCLSVPVIIFRLWELEHIIRAPWIFCLHSTCVTSLAIPCPSVTSGPHPASTASPCTSDCPSAEQCQCGHDKNQ